MAQTVRGPYLRNIEGLIQAGLDPKTGLPTGCVEQEVETKSQLKRSLRTMNKAEAVRRYVWHNLPDGLTSEMIENVLFERGQGAFFKLPDDKFYFLPFALDGTIDIYGRYNSITPLPFNGSSQDKNDKPLIEGLTYDCIYEAMIPEDFLREDDTFDTEEMLHTIEKSAVIVRDYTPQLGQTNIARSILDEPVLDLMSDCIPFMRTALLNSTGIKGMRVASQDDANQVFSANKAINNASLTGQWAVPMVAMADFQELTSNGGVGRAEEFMLALQSLDNFRLSLLGIPNGGVFGKKAHMLQSEQELNAGTASLVLQDGLFYRQWASTIFNTIHGLGTWCEINESITQMDKDGDGDAYGNNDENAPTATTDNEGGMSDDTI